MEVDRFDAVERRFLAAVLDDVQRAGEVKAEVMHVQTHRTMAAAGMPTADGLRTLYRMAFGHDGPAFSPQIGWLLARLGPEQRRRFREALA